jgi:hypothetical protein
MWLDLSKHVTKLLAMHPDPPFAAPVRPGAFSVALANPSSSAAMSWYLLLRRPEAPARLRESWNE